ncbi:MAG: MBL fold metallo-hydrolase [bacterium]|nr:MBL fold metallo-hydrolase [bacterium]
MTIQYHGDACVRLSGKYAEREFSVLVDPYDAKQTGLKPLRPSSVDLVLSTTGELPSFGEGPYLIRGPGEYEACGVSVQGIPHNGGTIYRIVAEDVAIAHLGNASTALDDAAIDALGEVDVLFVPVGGHGVLTAVDAAALVERVEPRIIVPIQYAVADSSLPYDRLDAFCKEMGCSEKDAEEKLKLSKKDLPGDEMWVKVLQVE